MNGKRKKKVILAAEKIGVTKKSISIVRSDTFIKRGHVFIVLAVIATFSLSVLSILAKLNPYFPADLATTRFLQRINFYPFHQLMYFMSILGNGIYKYFVLAAVFLLIYLRKRRKEALMLLFSSVGAELISIILKHLVSRNRPDPKLISSVLHFDTPDSFPSGHVLFYVGFFGFLLFLVYSLIPKSGIRNLLIAVCLFFVILIGPSRIYLGAHWLSDVMGAYLAGFLWVLLSIYIYTKKRNK